MKGVWTLYIRKLILTYSLISLVLLVSLTFIITGKFEKLLLSKEIMNEKQFVEDFTGYMDNTIAAAKNIIEEIYLSDQSFKEDFFYWLSTYNDGQLSYEELNKKRKFDSLFSKAMDNTPEILDIIISNNDIVAYAYSRFLRDVNQVYDFSQFPWYRDIKGINGRVRIIPSYQPKYIVNQKKYVYTLAATIFNTDYKPQGVILFNMGVEFPDRFFKKYNKDTKGLMLVLNKQGEVIYDSSGSFLGRKYPYFTQLESSRNYTLLNEQECLITLDKSSKNGFVVAGIITKKELFGGISKILQPIYLILIIFVIIGVLLIFFNSVFLSTKINHILKAIKEVKTGNLKARIPVRNGKDELEQISIQFNAMCEKLDEYIKKVYFSGLRQKDAELAALQAQINPHFLYNTIEAIRMKAILNNERDLANMLYLLSDLFRMSIKGDGMFVTIEDEIAYCKSYLDLHGIRHGEKLKTEFAISKEIKNSKIPKLLLQPIIENAIIHGMETISEGQIRITIEGCLKDGNILISVADNGAGIEPGKLEELKNEIKSETQFSSDKSIGLRNVNDRIKLIYGDNYELDLDSTPQKGTKITIVLPEENRKEALLHV